MSIGKERGSGEREINRRRISFIGGSLAIGLSRGIQAE
jgi:hypothetical protein